MGTPNEKDARPLESLDTMLNRLVTLVTGKDCHETQPDHAETVEESVRRLDARRDSEGR